MALGQNMSNTSNSSYTTSDEDDGTFLCDMDKQTLLQEAFPFKVLSMEQVVQHMQECIDEVTTIVETEQTIVRILLNHFNWNKEKLFERYFDGDIETLFCEAHIIKPNISFGYLQHKETVVFNMSGKCLICFSEDVEVEGLACGHKLCIDCWEGYLTMQIMEEGIGQTISCAAYKCDILVDDQTVMKLIKDTKVKLRYQRLITNSFVDCNRLLQWCPQPLCNHVIKVEYVDMQPVTCTCGHKFCFLCFELWHDPINCQLLKRWKKLNNDDKLTENWIASNAKECPKCSVPIEKNGGCNHMTCTNYNCRAEFCWICLQFWKSHSSGAYNCNRYDKRDASISAKSPSVHQRFLFYYDRYKNQMRSIEFTSGLYASVKEKFEKIKFFETPDMKTQFWKKAVDVLYQCRQTLIYTYVFAYYVKSNNQFEIFVDNQSDLEKAIEMLSEYLEQDINEETAVGWKMKVLDKSRYCENRCRVLLNHVHEGYEMNWWEFI